MRDPNRIRVCCDRLCDAWSKVPDWRFGQLISNVFGEFVSKTGRDIFFPEDDEMFNFIENYFNQTVSKE